MTMRLAHCGSFSAESVIRSWDYLRIVLRYSCVSSSTYINIGREGLDHRVGHFRPPGMAEGVVKLPVLQALRCFYRGPSSAGVAGAMIKANAIPNIITERVDDVPLLLEQMQRMGLPMLMDEHFPAHGNWYGLRLGWVSTIWLSSILSRGDHRLVHVEP